MYHILKEHVGIFFKENFLYVYKAHGEQNNTWFSSVKIPKL